MWRKAVIQPLGGLECCEMIESGVAWDVEMGARADTGGCACSGLNGVWSGGGEGVASVISSLMSGRMPGSCDTGPGSTSS